MTITVSGAVVVGGVRYPAQVQIDVPDPVRKPEKQEEE
jgi:hypothetical protein